MSTLSFFISRESHYCQKNCSCLSLLLFLPPQIHFHLSFSNNNGLREFLQGPSSMLVPKSDTEKEKKKGFLEAQTTLAPLKQTSA